MNPFDPDMAVLHPRQDAASRASGCMLGRTVEGFAADG